jgi:hypothetical protein
MWKIKSPSIQNKTLRIFTSPQGLLVYARLFVFLPSLLPLDRRLTDDQPQEHDTA